MGLVGLILKHEPQLAVPVPIEDLCLELDIREIAELDDPGFTGSLVTDRERSAGIILVQTGLPPQKRRFTIAHELGHFLMPSHIPDETGKFLCSADDMLQLDAKELSRRQRMEVEANLFASLILMPPPILREKLKHRADIRQLLPLARYFDVSKEAMARAYVDYHGEALAAVITHNGVVRRIYKNRSFTPYIQTGIGQAVDAESLFHEKSNLLNEPTRWVECDPEIWLGLNQQNRNISLSEQVYLQQDGYALILLKTEFADDAEEDEEPQARFSSR